MAIGPFEVGYPVDFRSGGDTVKETFSKHIQEIQRIYGYLNALNVDKLSASEYDASALPSHISSTNPHPNWLIDLASQVTGLLPAAKVSGLLSNANINTGNVNGLNAFVQGLINASIPSVGEFACNLYDEGTWCNGYADFNIGLQIRFGRHLITDYGSTTANETTLRSHNFARRFTTHCSCMVVALADNDNTVATNKNWAPMIHVHSATGFDYHIEAMENNQSVTNMEISYIAIGH